MHLYFVGTNPEPDINMARLKRDKVTSIKAKEVEPSSYFFSLAIFGGSFLLAFAGQISEWECYIEL